MILNVTWRAAFLKRPKPLVCLISFALHNLLLDLRFRFARACLLVRILVYICVYSVCMFVIYLAMLAEMHFV